MSVLEFRQKQKRRRVLSSNITIAVLAIIVVLVGKEVWDIYQKERFARDLLAQAKTQYENLEKRDEFLESELSALESDSGVESKLRERFGIARPGEKVIMLIDQEATTSVPETRVSWWEKMTAWFR